MGRSHADIQSDTPNPSVEISNISANPSQALKGTLPDSDDPRKIFATQAGIQSAMMKQLPAISYILNPYEKIEVKLLSGKKLKLTTCKSMRDIPIAELYARESQLIIRNPETGKEIILFKKQKYIFGRSSFPKDFFNPRTEDAISRNHFGISYDNKEGDIFIFLTDLRSTNGTAYGVSEFVQNPVDLFPEQMIAGGKDGIVKLESGAIIGMCFRKSRKKCNEDSMAIGSFYAAVADGMGGHGYAAEASQQAILAVMTNIHDPSIRPEKIFQQGCDNIRESIHELENDPGSTLAFVRKFPIHDRAGWSFVQAAHAGDSKFIIVPDNAAIEPILSKDQTPKQTSIDKGKCTKLEAFVNPGNIISNYVSHKGLAHKPQIVEKVFQDNSATAVVFSDGISKLVTDEEIILFIRKYGEKAIQEIVQLAESRKGKNQFFVKLEGKMQKADYGNYDAGEDDISIGIVRI